MDQIPIEGHSATLDRRRSTGGDESDDESYLGTREFWPTSHSSADVRKRTSPYPPRDCIQLCTASRFPRRFLVDESGSGQAKSVVVDIEMAAKNPAMVLMEYNVAVMMVVFGPARGICCRGERCQD